MRRPSLDRTWRETLFDGACSRLLEGVKNPKVFRFFSMRMISRFAGAASGGKRLSWALSVTGASIGSHQHGDTLVCRTTNKNRACCLETYEQTYENLWHQRPDRLQRS